MNRRLLLLGSVALVLGVFLLLERGMSPPVGEAEAPSPAGAQPVPPAEGQTGTQAKLNPLEGLDAGRFPAMLERPLFNPGRAERPPEPPPEPPPPPAEEPPPELPSAPPGPAAEDYMLVAVAAGPSGRVAAVRLAATGEVLYLREGQPIQSWNVMAVDDRSVVIGTPESNVEIKLFASMADEAQEPVDQAPPPEQGFEPPADMGIDHGSMENYQPPPGEIPQ